METGGFVKRVRAGARDYAERVPITTLSIVVLAVTGSVITMGGMIRIYDAGESCPDWPTCFGTWGFDVSEEEQGAWWEENPEEEDSRGAQHRYTTFEIFTEWFHRLLAGALLGPMMLLLWVCTRVQSTDRQVRNAGLLGLILIIWQGFLGWLTVRMDNEHWSVALHLVSALAFTLCILWLLLSRWRETGKTPEAMKIHANSKQRRMVALSSIGALSAVFIGVYVSTTEGANYGCGVAGISESWPLCHGELLIPVDDIATDSQIIHRTIVALEGVALLIASFTTWKRVSFEPESRRLAQWVALATSVFLFNGLLGGLYVISYDPGTNSFWEVLSLLHLLVGSISFLILATIWIASREDMTSIPDGISS